MSDLPSWQTRLSLSSWEITCEEVDDLGDDKTCAYYYRADKTARVQIERGIADPERRLVHELVHLVLLPIVADVEDLTEEQQAALERVVQALVEALLPS